VILLLPNASPQASEPETLATATSGTVEDDDISAGTTDDE
jgi:hypothetical protein